MEQRGTTGRLARQVRCCALIVSILTGVARPAGAVCDLATGGLRPLQSRGGRLIAESLSRSMTFRWLIDDIAQSDVVVYVDLDPYDGRRLDGVLNFVGRTACTRFVKVWLRPTRIDDEMVVTLGHELQHAREVAYAPEVVSPDSLAAFYMRSGRSNNPGEFETTAALEVAAQIRSELTRRPRVRGVVYKPKTDEHSGRTPFIGRRRSW